MESLLGDFQTRVKRTATRKGSRKTFDFLKRSEVVVMAKSSSAESAESVTSVLTNSGEGMEDFNGMLYHIMHINVPT